MVNIFGPEVGALATIVGAALLIISFMAKRWDMGVVGKDIALIIGSGFAVFGVAVLCGVGAMFTPATADITEKASYEVSAAEADTHLTYNSNTREFQWVVDYSTSAFVNNQQYAEVTFTISRLDTLDANQIVKCELGNVGRVDITDEPNEYIIDQNADKSFKAKWIKEGGSYFWGSAVQKVESSGDAVVTLNLTLNGAAVAGMDVYETVYFDVVVSGVDYTFKVLRSA